MANVLTNLAADIYTAADKVGREQVGFIPSVTVNGNGAQRAAIGDPVRSAFTREVVTQNRNVGMATSEGTDQTVDNKTMTITKDKSVEIPWTGEDILHVNNGQGFETIYGDQLMQAMRAIANEQETDLAVAAYQAASRAYGTAGTTPFASTLADPAQVRKILADNGAPMADINLVIDSTAGAALRTLANLNNVNESGGDSMLRQGILLPLHGMNIRESAQVQTHTKGTGSAYTSDTAGYAIGATAITLITGTGTVLTGDVVTFAGDAANKYIVETGVAAPGVITLAAPGLRQAIPASATAMTIGNSYAANVAFERSAVELAIRAPARPVIGGVVRDSAEDRMTMTDPRSGLPYEISFYTGQGKAMIEIASAWGVKAWKPQNIAALLG